MFILTEALGESFFLFDLRIYFEAAASCPLPLFAVRIGSSLVSFSLGAHTESQYLCRPWPMQGPGRQNQKGRAGRAHRIKEVYLARPSGWTKSKGGPNFNGISEHICFGGTLFLNIQSLISLRLTVKKIEEQWRKLRPTRQALPLLIKWKRACSHVGSNCNIATSKQQRQRGASRYEDSADARTRRALGAARFHFLRHPMLLLVRP